MIGGIDTKQAITLGVLGLVALTLLAVVLVLGVGLFKARSLLKRELLAYFYSPIAYVVMVLFLLVTGHLFYLTLQLLTAKGAKGVEFPLQLMLGDERFWLVFLFIPPLLTMRTFAEERSSGTLEMLMTAPLKDWQVVLCKYLACLGFYVLMWLPTLAYLPVLLDLQNPRFAAAWTPFSISFVSGLGAIVVAGLLTLLPLGSGGRAFSLFLAVAGLAAALVGGWLHYHRDNPLLYRITAGIDPMPALSSYLGIFLAGAMFLSLGLVVSSLVRSQMVSALLALVLGLPFIAAGFWRPDMDPSGITARAIAFVSVPLHFHQNFTRGIVDTRHLILYASMTMFCLFLTTRSLESRRWQ